MRVFYSMREEGRIRGVTVMSYEKRYVSEKYYVYILKVERDGQSYQMNILRTYKEFCELHQKLCMHFPLAKIHRYVYAKYILRTCIEPGVTCEK